MRARTNASRSYNVITDGNHKTYIAFSVSCSSTFISHILIYNMMWIFFFFFFLFCFLSILNKMHSSLNIWTIFFLLDCIYVFHSFKSNLKSISIVWLWLHFISKITFNWFGSDELSNTKRMKRIKKKRRGNKKKHLYIIHKWR